MGTKTNRELFELSTAICQQVDAAVTGEPDSPAITSVQMLEMVDVLLCATARIVLQFDESVEHIATLRNGLHECLDHWLDTISNGDKETTNVH